MTRNAYIEIALAVVLLGISVLVLNPFHFWMPDMAHIVVLGCLVAAFGAFSALVLREQASDEREEAHRMLSGRVAFLTGATILVVAIAYQSEMGNVDPWLVFALVGMVFAKLLVRLYGDLRL